MEKNMESIVVAIHFCIPYERAAIRGPFGTRLAGGVTWLYSDISYHLDFHQAERSIMLYRDRKAKRGITGFS